MSEKADRSVQFHQDGILHCAQAITSVYGPDLGLDAELAIKVASGFGGGLGRSGEICGTIIGAMIVLGMTYDHSEPDARDKVYALVRKYRERFVERNGSIRCRDLLGYDNSTIEGLQTIREQKLIEKVCKKIERDSAEILEELLQEVRPDNSIGV